MHPAFDRAIAAMDAANSADPNALVVGDQSGPKELVHAEMLTRWVRSLCAEPSEALLLAARGHHIERWRWPRSEYPEGRGGYLRWRADLHSRHAERAAEILRGVGYDEPTIERVSELIHKRGLGRDPDVQVLEDGLCLVFLKSQFDELAGRLPDGRMAGIIRKTWNKMSEAGRARALEVVSPSQAATITAALAV